VTIASRFILKISDFKRSLGVVVVRAMIKLVVGVLFGLLLAMLLSLFQLQSATALIGLFMGVLVLGNITSLLLYQRLLKRLWSLHFRIRTLIVSGMVELFLFVILLSAVNLVA
jgi:hypothetical protein